MYDENEYCMEFSNKDIIEFLVRPLMKYPEIEIRVLSNDNELLVENALTEKSIEYVCFDGDIENFHISFYGHQTSIFITDETPLPEQRFTFNEEFMFIDDKAKMNIVSSDTYGNVVYEGELRTKTHKEILELFKEFILLLVGTKAISVEETVVSQVGWQYPKCTYVVNITNSSGKRSEIQIDNILFKVNQK